MKARFRIEYKLTDDGEKRIYIQERSGVWPFVCWSFIAGVYQGRNGEEPSTEAAIKRLLAIIDARHAGQSWVKRTPLHFDAMGNKL